MKQRRVVALAAAIAAALVSLALFGGSASASLPGPGGGEPLSCSYSSSSGWAYSNNIGAVSVTGIPCWGNIVGFEMSLAGATCANSSYDAYVFVSGASSSWFTGYDYCVNGAWNYSTYYSKNATQGEQLNFRTVCSLCKGPVYYGVKVWKQ